MSNDSEELAELHAAVRETLRALRAEVDAPTLARSVVTEHNLTHLAGLVGMEWHTS